MTAFLATWLPPAIARTAAPAGRPRGRHLAPETPGAPRIARPEDLRRRGRHAESEWDRQLHDPKRDMVDPFAWLGFADPVGA
jgi:hypothetical protein